MQYDKQTSEFLIVIFLAFEATFIAWVQPQTNNVLKWFISKSKRCDRHDNIPIIQKIIRWAELLNRWFSNFNTIWKFLNIITLAGIPIIMLWGYRTDKPGFLGGLDFNFWWSVICYYVSIKAGYYLLQFLLFSVVANAVDGTVPTASEPDKLPEKNTTDSVEASNVSYQKALPAAPPLPNRQSPPRDRKKKSGTKSPAQKKP